MANQKGHPTGLYLLFVTEMAERFSYYGMRALFVLYMVSAFFSNEYASQIYGSYTGLVYLTPLLGGYIADRYWGNRKSIIAGGILMAIGQFLMFFSACTVKQSIMQEGGAIDASVDNGFSLFLMFAGLGFLIFGNGFFKHNISTMVGDLYEKTDSRKDSAFTIFYMGINVGAFIAPLICGSLGNGNWANPSNFKWGFFCAGVAMVLSIAQANNFKSAMTYEILLMVVLGGIGSITGSVIGSLLFVAASEWWLRGLDSGKFLGIEAPNIFRNGFRLVVFSVIIMIVVLFFREGIMGEKELPDLFRKKKKDPAKEAQS
jgi:dipeptide/tripeptide permease